MKSTLHLSYKNFASTKFFFYDHSPKLCNFVSCSHLFFLQRSKNACFKFSVVSRAHRAHIYIERETQFICNNRISVKPLFYLHWPCLASKNNIDFLVHSQLFHMNSIIGYHVKKNNKIYNFKLREATTLLTRLLYGPKDTHRYILFPTHYCLYHLNNYQSLYALFFFLPTSLLETNAQIY